MSAVALGGLETALRLGKMQDIAPKSTRFSLCTSIILNTNKI